MKYNFFYFCIFIILILFIILFNSYTKEGFYIENFRSYIQWSGFHPTGYRN